MSFMSKIKDFFYDEEEIEEVDEPKKQKKIKNEPKKKVNIYDIEREKEKANLREQKKQDISEKELFKAERTFNFPVDVTDEDDFEPVRRESSIPNENRFKRESESAPIKTRRSSYSYSPYKSINSSKKEEKHFKPTPIISPIYGVLNENYKKEDITDVSKTKEFSFDRKELDFDTIRKKAYADLDNELEKTLNGKQKDIFYNLDKQISGQEEVKQQENLKEEYVEKPYKKDEVVITYEDEEKQEELEVPKITRTTKNKAVAKEIQKEEDDSKDLFKIIDDMYKESDEEEE